VNTPRPGDFPIGSVESRAAMRFELSNQSNNRPCLLFVSYVPRAWRGDRPEPKYWNKAPRINAPQPWGDGLMRMLYVPPGMTTEEARKIAEEH